MIRILWALQFVIVQARVTKIIPSKGLFLQMIPSYCNAILSAITLFTMIKKSSKWSRIDEKKKIDSEVAKGNSYLFSS